MAKRLATTVHVSDDKHSSEAFAAETLESDLPDWAKSNIGEHAFYDDAAEPEESAPEVVVPFGAPNPEAKPDEAEPKSKTTKSAKGADSK